MKKAQGLSMNVIIIAAIALLVLVILSVLVLRAGGGLNTGTSCKNIGDGKGQCIDSASDCGDLTPGSWITDLSHGCGNEQKCCIQLGGE